MQSLYESHYQPQYQAPSVTSSDARWGPRLLPIAIPQVTNRRGAPFVRAYAPDLADLGISEVDFVKFIDSVKREAQANSALAGLDLTGSLIRKIPLPTIPIIGHDISTASKYGNAQLSKSCLTAHIQSVNETMLAARGLRASLCIGKVLKARVSPPGSSLLAPLQLDVPAEHQLSVWQRRMASRQGQATAVHETTLPMEGGGVAAKLMQSQKSRTMADENHDPMKSRRQLLKGRRHGGRDIDWEEKAAEQMMWVVVESVGGM